MRCAVCSENLNGKRHYRATNSRGDMEWFCPSCWMEEYCDDDCKVEEVDEEVEE